MKEFRVWFTDSRVVDVEAVNETEAMEIVKNRGWEYGMDWEDKDVDEPIEITDIQEFD